MNVDVKIGSKAIAKRLEKVLPYIIYHDQNAFVKDVQFLMRLEQLTMS